MLEKELKIPNSLNIKLEYNKIIINNKINKSIDIYINKNINLFVNNDRIIIKVLNKKYKSFLNLYKALINKSFIGLLQNNKIKLNLKGIGYKAFKEGNNLILKLGYSHDIIYNIPNNIDLNIVNNNIIILISFDYLLLTQFVHKIKKSKKIDPYKGKGILLKNDIILIKEGKKNKK